MFKQSEPLEGTPLIAPSTTSHKLYDPVVEACRTVYDPEIPVNIYDLGLIYTITLDHECDVHIVMTLTAPGCPVAGDMPGWVQGVASFMPMRHLSTGLLDVLVRDATVGAILVPLAVLLGFAAVVTLVATRVFTWDT